jgi:response regulator RpfG family c-di-GMP phosphodiesterase
LFKLFPHPYQAFILSDSRIIVYIIEDNKMDALVASSLIKKALPLVSIQCFEEGLSPIRELEKAIANNTTTLPDLIFLDMTMPDFDGFNFLDSYATLPLESLPIRPLIYILTTSLSVVNVNRAKSYPFVEDVLFKGFSHKMFASLVNKHFPYLDFVAPAKEKVMPTRELTLENWVSEYKRLELSYKQQEDKQSGEARGILDQLEAVWMIIQELNSKNKDK